MSMINVRSEITGSVWKILVKPGDSVAEDDSLLIFESMKMEIPVIAEDGGVLRELRVTEGVPVTEGQVVAVVEE